MKYLFLLLLASCSPFGYDFKPKFQKGDCLIQGRDLPEPWHKGQYLILEVGTHSYLVKTLIGTEIVFDLNFYNQGGYQKISCK